jgi:hypothetical protein
MICDDAITDALVKELCSGRKFKEALQNKREIEAAAEARRMREAKSILGKPIGSVPDYEYYTVGGKYGMECWDDREFVRDFFKSQTHLRAGNI